MKLIHDKDLTPCFVPTKLWPFSCNSLRGLKCVIKNRLPIGLRIACPIRPEILHDVVIIQDYFHEKFGNFSSSRSRAFEVEKLAEYQLRKFGFVKKA